MLFIGFVKKHFPKQHTSNKSTNNGGTSSNNNNNLHGLRRENVKKRQGTPHSDSWRAGTAPRMPRCPHRPSRTSSERLPRLLSREQANQAGSSVALRRRSEAPRDATEPRPRDSVQMEKRARWLSRWMDRTHEDVIEATFPSRTTSTSTSTTTTDRSTRSTSPHNRAGRDREDANLPVLRTLWTSLARLPCCS